MHESRAPQHYDVDDDNDDDVGDDADDRLNDFRRPTVTADEAARMCVRACALE